MISIKDNFAAILERVKDGLRGMKTGCWGEDRGRFCRVGFKTVLLKRISDDFVAENLEQFYRGEFRTIL